MKRFLDSLITAVVLVFFIPTTLILVSWNAIPGDGLYPLKSGLENMTLALLSGTPFVPKVSMKYTDRRITEATALLDKKGSTVGYDLLVAEATQTQNYIAEKSDVQSAVQFSKNIDGYKQQIESKKVEIRRQENLPVPTPTVPPAVKQTATTPPESTTSNTSSQTVVVSVPQEIVIHQEDPEEIIKKLDDTQKKLDDIQEKVKENAKDEHSNSDGRQNQENGAKLKDQ